MPMIIWAWVKKNKIIQRIQVLYLRQVKMLNEQMQIWKSLGREIDRSIENPKDKR